MMERVSMTVLCATRPLSREKWLKKPWTSEIDLWQLANSERPLPSWTTKKTTLPEMKLQKREDVWGCFRAMKICMMRTISRQQTTMQKLTKSCTSGSRDKTWKNGFKSNSSNFCATLPAMEGMFTRLRYRTCAPTTSNLLKLISQICHQNNQLWPFGLRKSLL